MGEAVLTLSDNEFEQQVIQANKPTLVDFWAEWCAPCRAIAPVVEELAQNYAGKLQVGKLNIDQHPNIPGKYAIRAIPTLLLFKNGQVVEQIVGLASRSKLEDVIKKHVA